MTHTRTLRVTINGTGFAGSYTAACYGMIPHKNGVNIELAGVSAAHRDSAETFATENHVVKAYTNHAEMVAEVRPHIDNIACANHVHGQYVMEAAEQGVSVIVLEKPPVIWPGYAEGREANARTRKEESMVFLGEVLDAVRRNRAKLLYAENFVYLDGIKAAVQLLREAMKSGKGKVLYQRGICAHQGSHAPAYDTPSKSGGGALFNKACHPLGSVLFLKQMEGILRFGMPIRPARVSALAAQILKHQPEASGEHFRVMHNVDDFGRITVEFEDKTIAEVIGHDLSISGIRNEVSLITDFSEQTLRINPSDQNELFLPHGVRADNLELREKLPTAEGTSFPCPRQFHAHGYVNEAEDAVDCALEPERHPQSGALMAWDTLAVLLTAYESSDAGGRFIDLGEFREGRSFEAHEMPDPHMFGRVLSDR